MISENKNKVYGAAGTLLLHVAVVLLLFVLTLEAAPPAIEKGVPTEMLLEPEFALANMVNLPSGEKGAAQANSASKPDTPSQVPESATPPSAPAAENLIAQNEESTVNVPTSEETEKNEESEAERQERLRKEEEARLEAERKRAEEEARRKLEETSANMANAFNFGKQQETTGEGKDDPEEEGKADNPQGKGNSGKNIEAGGRTPIQGTYVNPVHNVNESGTVIVTFTIYDDGSVSNFAVSPASTKNTKMQQSAMEAAKKIKFKPSNKPTGPIIGKITYNFGIR